MKFQTKPIQGRPPRLQAKEIKELFEKYPVDNKRGQIVCKELKRDTYDLCDKINKIIES